MRGFLRSWLTRRGQYATAAALIGLLVALFFLPAFTSHKTSRRPTSSNKQGARDGAEADDENPAPDDPEALVLADGPPSRK
jgi:hypothetical protein